MPATPTPLDRLLAALKTPALAADLALQPELWNEIKRLADIHRFLGLLAHVSSPWLPPSERPWRDRVLMQHHQRHAQRLGAMRRLMEAFANEKIVCVSLKGSLLAERYYPDPFLRPSNDLDLLIYERDIGPAARLMIDLGFPLESAYPWTLQRRIVQHLNFGPAAGSPRVELHYRWRAGGMMQETAEFVDRSVIWRSSAGFDARVLSSADEAFHSCVHAAHHSFHRLRWLLDLVTIARRLTPQDRAHVRELALRLRQTGHFVAAALAAQVFFGETPDLGCQDFPAPWLPLSSAHARQMVERVEGNTATLGEKIAYRLDLFRMTDSPAQAASLLIAMLSRQAREKWYKLGSPASPDILARTLPD